MREYNTRTTKGDYSITFETDDRKAFEKVEELCRLLIDGKDGDVIPIEWLKRIKAKYLDYMSVCVVNEILNLWESKNEID